MKKIVKGNDFTLRIPVAKMVEGQPQFFPLPVRTWWYRFVISSSASLLRLRLM